jgi:hypothetical protein
MVDEKMQEAENLLDVEKVNALISAAAGAALDLGCNWLECAQAFRALMNSSLNMIGENAREIFLQDEQEESESPQ